MTKNQKQDIQPSENFPPIKPNQLYLIEKISHHFPNCEILTDNLGQIIIYTGVCEKESESSD